MKKLIKNLIEVESVLNVIYFSFDGDILFHYVKQEQAAESAVWDLSLFSSVLTKIQEAELVFENNLFYIIRSRHGFLLTVMDRSASVALIRLTCSVLLPKLEQKFKSKVGRLKQFFRKRKS